MLKYIGKRLLIGVITLFVLATTTFFLMKLMPGSPFASEGKFISKEAQAAMVASYGLDKPVLEQYKNYMGNAIQGDFGTSYRRIGTNVSDIVAASAPVTIKLGLTAFVIAIVVGIGLGVAAALSKRKWVNNVVMFVSTIGVSMPSFLIALLLMLSLGVWLRVLPIVGLATPLHYIMPATALALYPISMISRLTRSSMLEVMKQDYMILAKSKGSSPKAVIFKHALKNAMLPVITYAGPMIAFLTTGSFIVETIFSIPGIGSEYVSSVSTRDYPMIMALTILLGSMVIVLNLASDVISAIIDPRIKLGE
ncbi:MAG: ABC transporter permease [Erysipelotrichaceae bacterium]